MASMAEMSIESGSMASNENNVSMNGYSMANIQ